MSFVELVMQVVPSIGFENRVYALTGPLVQYHHQTYFRLVDGAAGFPLPQLSKEPGC